MQKIPLRCAEENSVVIYNHLSKAFSEIMLPGSYSAVEYGSPERLEQLSRGVRYLRVQSMKWPAAGALLALAGLAGCGSQYRPVINPITKTGPASQPEALVAVFSQPNLIAASAANTTVPCPGTQYANPGVVTVLDATGDSVAAQATLGYGPLGFSLDPTGSTAYSENCDGTISAMSISTELMTKDVTTSSLLPGSNPINSLVLSSGQYVVEEGHNAIAAMNGTPPNLQVEITNVAPGVINLTGVSGAQRIYSISQGTAYGACANPSSVTVDGEADGIEIASNSISSRIPLGVCPVYGVTSADGKRAFILNRGSGTITVINAQSNSLDTVNASSNLNGTGTINLGSGSGPVDADFYTPGNLLVVANYDNGTLSVIDTSLDVYGNDSATFGNVLKTISLPASPNPPKPSAVSVLQDGSRAYVADEANGVVDVVSLTSFTVLKTIQIPPVTLAGGGTATAAIRSIVSNYNYPAGNVFVGAQNSPYVTVIRTDDDTISAQILVQGNVVDLRATTQYAGQSLKNTDIDSRSVGSGVP